MRGLKILVISSFLISFAPSAFSQQDTVNQAETTRVTPAPARIQDSPRRVSRDSSVSGRAPRRVVDSAALVAAQLLRDSLAADSIRKASIPIAKKVLPPDTSSYKKYHTHPFLQMDKPGVFMLIDYHRKSSKDELFYIMAGILFCLAFIRAGFPKYFRNVFMLFFQTNLRQKQTRDQLLQDNLASLLINLLFFASAGLYISLLIHYNNWAPVSFWLLAVACMGALVLIYLVKYLFLIFSGWVFNVKEAAGSYIFLVFLVNKVMGVLLIPFLLILAFASTDVVKVAVTISFGLVGLMYAYRYFVSFSALRSKLKVNVLHFFLYLCAVEVLPLLLIYKVLINYFGGSL